jgi:multidrug transporter EmrE-like cation transporter
MRWFLPLTAMIACTVAANLLMKLGSKDPTSALFLNVLSWRTAYGFVAFGCAGLFYAIALRYLPLSVAQSYAAIQFIAVILASKIILAESIDFARWLGISLIMTGIIVVAINQVH